MCYGGLWSFPARAMEGYHTAGFKTLFATASRPTNVIMATHGVVTPPFAQAWLRLALTHTFCFIHSECRQSIDSLVIAPIPQQDLRARAERDSKVLDGSDRLFNSGNSLLEGMAGCKKTKVFRHWMWSTTQQQTKLGRRL
ncbi:hypothetical protein B0H19DRAFT_1071793 [Mycena capillaripes]|nr:hypothetical protein B0H19DRAFT_1071793 [Mycena capillaripes]